MRLLLASGSATRRKMLQGAGVPFTVAMPGADEEQAKRELLRRAVSARDLALNLAEVKALSVEGGPDELVLGSDQVLELDDGSMLSKASSREAAAEQLRTLSGRTHRLHSAAVLAHGGSIDWRGTESVTLRVRPLSDDFIEEYLTQEFAVAGGSVGVYRVEGPGAQLFESIDGSHFAVLGLPLLPLLAELRRREMLTS